MKFTRWGLCVGLAVLAVSPLAGCSDEDGTGGTGGSGATGTGNSPGSGGGGNSTGSGNTTGSGSGNGLGGDGTGNTGGCVPDYDCQPEPPAATGDDGADCVARINQFRACVCLPPLERWTEGESCANEHAEYDVDNGAHAGFGDNICDSGGWAQNECPGWGSTEDVIDGCLQMMFDEGPPPTEDCEGQCYQDHGHYINMTNTGYSRVACGFYDDDGEMWSVQNFE